MDRRERLRRLALETIDLSKDPYFMRNHLGQYECRLCLTLHTNEGNYLAHTQGGWCDAMSCIGAGSCCRLPACSRSTSGSGRGFAPDLKPCWAAGWAQPRPWEGVAVSHRFTPVRRAAWQHMKMLLLPSTGSM